VLPFGLNERVLYHCKGEATMSAITTGVALPETTSGSVFVMVPVDHWNALVNKLKHYERIAHLRRLSEQMDEDPEHQAIPWDQVKQDLIDQGLLEAARAAA
jgi:hypothetical protein